MVSPSARKRSSSSCSPDAGETRTADDGRERSAEDVERRHRDRADRRIRERQGSRRYRLGPGSTFYSPGMIGTSYSSRTASEEDLDREVDLIAAALEGKTATERRELARAVGAQRWGPGRFQMALREAVAEGRVRRVSRMSYGPGGLG